MMKILLYTIINENLLIKTKTIHENLWKKRKNFLNLNFQKILFWKNFDMLSVYYDCKVNWLIVIYLQKKAAIYAKIIWIMKYSWFWHTCSNNYCEKNIITCCLQKFCKNLIKYFLKNFDFFFKNFLNNEMIILINKNILFENIF